MVILMEEMIYFILFMLTIVGVIAISIFAIISIYKSSEMLGIIKFVLCIPFIITDVVALKVLFNVIMKLLENNVLLN